MRVHLFWYLIFLSGSILLRPLTATAADSKKLVAAFDEISRPQLDSSTPLNLTNYTLSSKDLRIHFTSGKIAFFKPLVLDSDTLVFGAHFEGEGLFQFAPQSDIEKNQVFRFFRTDSLSRKFTSMTMLFSPEVYESLKSAGQPSSEPLGSEGIQAASQDIARIGANEERQYFFAALRNLAMPIGEPFLMVDVEPLLTDRLYYLFDPYQREEIRLLKQAPQASVAPVDLVSSYSQYLDSSYRVINGLTKEQIVITHYVTSASLDKKGFFRGRADVTFNVTRAPVQMLPMTLGDDFQVDSVKDSRGREIAFMRYGEPEDKSAPLELYFDQPLAYRDTLTLSFFYQGALAQPGLDETYVNRTGDWYPKYEGYRQRAIFDMTFRTPPRFTMLASGNNLIEQSVGDTMVTTWRVIPPVVEVSMTMGMLHRFTYENEGSPPIDLLFSQTLHEAIARSAGVNLVPSDSAVQDQVANDLLNSLKLFSHYFGPYPYQQLAVDETRPQSFAGTPALVHLPFTTWKEFEKYPDDRLVRYDEAARQWWGVGVGYETYHDQWLNDGFAAYSALLYLQAIGGNDQFIEQLRRYRSDVFAARNYTPGSGEEAGPIALGSRTKDQSTSGKKYPTIFKKAALVIHMLRNLMIDFKTMNEDRFYGMLSEFYQTNRGKEVTTAEFQQIVEKYAGIKMDWFFREFVYGVDIPTYDFTYDFDQDSLGNYMAHGHIVTQGVDDRFQMFVPLEIQIDDVNRAYVRLLVDSTDYTFTLPSLPKRPKKLVLNPFESVLATVRQP